MDKFSAFMVAFFLFFSDSANCSDFKVVDGDSLETGMRRIRLDGIDAPEYTQICENSSGESYFCGQESLNFLRDFVSTKTPDCICLPQPDKYHREICECFIDGVSLNEYMVKNGWAEVYHSEKYLSSQKEAEQNKAGIWQGKHMRPALYRVLNRYIKQKEKN